MPFPLYLLALAVFAMGTSKFMLAGLLPDIASDLDVTVGTAATLTSAFAVGMVVGAPLVAALRPHVAQALQPSGVRPRLRGGSRRRRHHNRLPGAVHDPGRRRARERGFLAVALTTAAALVPPDKKGRALAVLAVGHDGGHGRRCPRRIGTRRVARLAGHLLGRRRPLPARRHRHARRAPPRTARGTERPTSAHALRTELAQLTGPRLLLVMLLGALVNAATFASFTFLAPVVTDTAGLGELWISVVLVLFGAGSFVGVTVAGRLSDQRPGLVLAVGGPLLLLGWPALAVLADEPVALFLLAGSCRARCRSPWGSTLITRVLYEAAGAPPWRGSYATAALNAGAAAGPSSPRPPSAPRPETSGRCGRADSMIAVALLIAFPFRAVIAAGRSAEMLR